jgi:hypothetical protein
VRDLVVTFRVNQGEYRQLQALAMGAGLSIGELLRSLVAEQVGRQGRSRVAIERSETLDGR